MYYVHAVSLHYNFYQNRLIYGSNILLVLNWYLSGISRIYLVFLKQNPCIFVFGDLREAICGFISMYKGFW